MTEHEERQVEQDWERYSMLFQREIPFHAYREAVVRARLSGQHFSPQQFFQGYRPPNGVRVMDQGGVQRGFVQEQEPPRMEYMPIGLPQSPFVRTGGESKSSLVTSLGGVGGSKLQSISSGPEERRKTVSPIEHPHRSTISRGLEQSLNQRQVPPLGQHQLIQPPQPQQLSQQPQPLSQPPQQLIQQPPPGQGELEPKHTPTSVPSLLDRVNVKGPEFQDQRYGCSGSFGSIEVPTGERTSMGYEAPSFHLGHTQSDEVSTFGASYSPYGGIFGAYKGEHSSGKLGVGTTLGGSVSVFNGDMPGIGLNTPLLSGEYRSKSFVNIEKQSEEDRQNGRVPLPY